MTIQNTFLWILDSSKEGSHTEEFNHFKHLTFDHFEPYISCRVQCLSLLSLIPHAITHGVGPWLQRTNIDPEKKILNMLWGIFFKSPIRYNIKLYLLAFHASVIGNDGLTLHNYAQPHLNDTSVKQYGEIMPTL